MAVLGYLTKLKRGLEGVLFKVPLFHDSDANEPQPKYRNYLKERPGLNERPLRMSAPLHS